MSDKPALQPGADVGETLIAIARDLLARVSLEGSSDAEAIHGFRRNVKRWRAFLRLMQPLIEDEAVRLRLEARDLARMLAGARDAQAALDALADLADDYQTLSPASLASIKARIESARADAESLTLTDEAREHVLATLAHAADSIDRWPLVNVAFSDVAEALADGYRRARRAQPPDWSTVSAETLHELRSRVVVHRYQMELVEPLWPRLGHVWVGEAQRLRERLGKHQDLAVLAKLTAPRGLLARWRSRLTPVIEARQRDHIEAAMRMSRRMFAEKPGAFRRRIEALWAALS